MEKSKGKEFGRCLERLEITILEIFQSQFEAFNKFAMEKYCKML